jgi:hypothetical protein
MAVPLALRVLAAVFGGLVVVATWISLVGTLAC